MRTAYTTEISFLGRNKTEFKQKEKEKRNFPPHRKQLDERRSDKIQCQKYTHFRLLLAKGSNQRFRNVD